MSQGEKSRLFQALKAVNVEFTKHYREYTTAELQQKYDELRAVGVIRDEHIEPPQALVTEQPAPEVQPTAGAPVAGDDDAASAFFGYAPRPQEQPEQPRPETLRETAPVVERSPEEFAGQRQNTNPNALEPIRTDPVTGRVWYQEEVRKPATPQPRGRRVLQYTNSGTETKTVTLEDGTVESFEVSGRGTRTAEVKITLPSYQVGIYKDPRYPFRVHTYAGVEGFDFFEVQEFYGGLPELVPSEIKKRYVANVLCYDIRTTVRAIETEARQLALQGRIQL